MGYGKGICMTLFLVQVVTNVEPLSACSPFLRHGYAYRSQGLSGVDSLFELCVAAEIIVSPGLD